MVLFYWMTRFDASDFPAGLLLGMLFGASAVLALITISIRWIITKNFPHVIFPITLGLVLGATLGFTTFTIQDEMRRDSSEQLIDQLDIFYQDRGSHPEQLEELIPQYLDDIPSSHWGFASEAYHYARNASGTGYTLSYRSGPGSWVYDAQLGWTYLE